MARALVSIQKVEELNPIEGRDRIELARVEGWWVIVQKGRYTVGDQLVYFEVDSVLPPDPRWSGDLERYNHRVKIMKMAGVFSQGYTMPLSEISVAEWKALRVKPSKIAESTGLDLTAVLKVTKYEVDTWNRGTGEAKLTNKAHRANPYFRTFPDFIPKTDETRVQKLAGMLRIHEGKWAYLTEKLHGSSMTVYLKDGHFGVCSRNLELLRELPALPQWKIFLMKFGFFKEERLWRQNGEGPVTGHFWQAAIKGALEEKLCNLGRDIAIQGELVGPGICGNIYKLTEHQLWMFTAIDLTTRKQLSYDDLVDLRIRLNIKMVPVVGVVQVHTDVDQWVTQAEGYSQLASSTMREGLVIRSLDKLSNFSFKSVSQPWLLKYSTK